MKAWLLRKILGKLSKWSTLTSASYTFYSQQNYGNLNEKKALRAWKWNRRFLWTYHLLSGSKNFYEIHLKHEKLII